jgi:hypothetical protein
MMGSGPSNYVNRGSGVSGLSAAMEIDKTSLRALSGIATYKDLKPDSAIAKTWFSI